MYEPERKVQFKGATLPHALHVTGRIVWREPVMVQDFRHAAAQVVTTMPKRIIPSSSVLHFRGGRQASDRQAYPDPDGFFADLGQA